MSPLVLLGSLGTVLSTVAMLPHLAHAVRTRKPSGSSFAWGLGGVTSTIWLAYGVIGGGLLVAAPGLVTVPVNFVLAAWCWRAARQPRFPVIEGLVLAPEPVEDGAVFVPREWAYLLEGANAGDTLELPRIA